MKEIQEKDVTKIPGGRSVPAEKRTFFVNRELARSAGRKGGKACPKGARSFCDPEVARAAAKKGAEARALKKALAAKSAPIVLSK